MDEEIKVQQPQVTMSYFVAVSEVTFGFIKLQAKHN